MRVQFCDSGLRVFGIPLPDFLTAKRIEIVLVQEISNYWLVEFSRVGWRFSKALNQWTALRMWGRYKYSFCVRRCVGDGEHDSPTQELAIWRAAMALFCYGNCADGYRYYPGTLRQFQHDGLELEKYCR